MREKIISSGLVVIVIFFIPIFITSILTDFGNNQVKEEEKIINIQYDEGEIQLSLDSYLVGVVAAQMPAYYEEEALKAQAILARTYTMKKLEENPNVVFNEDIQAYYSNKNLEDMWGINDFAFYYAKIRDAVENTKNKVVTYNKELIDPVFHSTSIGITRSAKDTWGQEISYLQSVESIEDSNAPNYFNKYRFSLNEFQDKLKIDSPDIVFTKEMSNEIQIVERNKQGYILSIQIGNKIFTGEEFKKVFGLSSTNFEILPTKDSIEITSKGSGHGVGMSQYGANVLAGMGNAHEDILKHYYKGIILEKRAP